MMVQRDELLNIKQKIRGLSQKTLENGCSEAEAMAAMTKVGRLLEQYHLTMDEVNVREAKCATIYVSLHRGETRLRRRHPIDSCIIALANFCDVNTWFHTDWAKDDNNKYLYNKKGRTIKKTSYAFFGQEDDLELVQYLVGVIYTAIENESENFRQTDLYRKAPKSRKSTLHSFQRGMATRISQRLTQLKHDHDDLLRTKSNSTALIVLKGQLVEEEFKKTGIKLRSYTHHNIIRDWAGFNEGKAAGDKVNLSRPLKDAGRNQIAGLLEAK